MAKIVTGLNAVSALLLVGSALAGAITTQEARDAIEPLYEDEPQRYGPGTGKIPDDLPRPTERDYARISQAEKRRAARRARKLRNI